MMYNDIFKNFSEQYETVFGPVIKYNQLVAKNFTDLTNLQLDSARQYADIGIAQVQMNGQVRDVQSLISSGSKQMETMTKISQQMIEDGKKLGELASEFKSELEKLVSESMPKQK